jgi:hypothetical protein
MERPEQQETLQNTAIDHLDRLETLVGERLGRNLDHFRIILGFRGLVLRGSASSGEARQLAQDLTGRVARFPIAANEIVIRDAGVNAA